MKLFDCDMNLDGPSYDHLQGDLPEDGILEIRTKSLCLELNSQGLVVGMSLQEDL